MDLKEFKEKFADVAEEFAMEIRLAVTKEKDKEFDKERETFNSQLGDMSKRLDESDERIAKFEKSETIRTENELRVEADKIWDVALAKSELRESLYPKVRKHVSYSKFVNENVLDVEKFAETVAGEISDWEGRTKSEDVVLGTGTGGRSALGADGADDDKEKLANKERTSSLLALAGHKEDK